MSIPTPPRHASELPAGTILCAGRGFSTILADLDFETYSEAGFIWNGRKWTGLPNTTKKGISVVGAATYTEHASAEVLSLYYDMKDGLGPRFWRPDMPNPTDLIEYDGLLEAHNTLFEYWVWRNICTRYGWPKPVLSRFRCSMAKARAHGLPPGLGMAGDVLKISMRKDKEGDRLLKLFSVPQNPTKARPHRRAHPAYYIDDAYKLYAYNLRDIKAEAELSSLIPDLTPVELEFFEADKAINVRGVHIDLPGTLDCIAVLDQATEQYNGELQVITGGTVERASEVAKMVKWLDIGLSGLDEDILDETLKRDDLRPDQRRALEIRSLVGSASVKKLYAVRNRVSADGRLHDLFAFHAARTGRATGNGPQPTNLPNSGPELNHCGQCGHYSAGGYCKWCGDVEHGKPTEWNAAAMDDVFTIMKTRNLATVEYFFGNAVKAMSGCLRGLFCAAPGHDFISSDYSAIEAVVLAALAGEQWRMDVFNSHGKIYEMSASKISGVPFADFMAAAGYPDLNRPEWWTAPMTGKHHPLRKTVGKVAELASGYGGWIGAWKNFGADAFMTDDEIKKAILAWRKASPAIVEFWGGQFRGRPWDRDYRPELFGLEGAAIAAVSVPGKEFPVRAGIHYVCIGDVLYCRLPSGRDIAYHQPRLSPSSRGGMSLSYMGYNTNPKMGPMGWARMETYAGKLTENVVQAVACDILRFAVVNCERKGYPVVLHVYDEICSEVPQGFGSIEEFERIMGTLPHWAEGWPIKAAGGWRGRRYRK